MNSLTVQGMAALGRSRQEYDAMQPLHSTPSFDGNINSIDYVMNLVDEIANDMCNINFGHLFIMNLSSLVNCLAYHGPQVESICKEQLDRAYVAFRKYAYDERIVVFARKQIMHLIELRARNWVPDEAMSRYYKSDESLQMFPSDSPSAQLMPTVSPLPLVASPPPPPLLAPGETIKASGKFPTPTKIPGKNYFKDEVVIRNSDSGKVNPGARERLVQVTGPDEAHITYARQLISQTITRNASPVPFRTDQGDAERVGGSSSSVNSSASDESARPQGYPRSKLHHSLSTNDASVGDYKYTVNVGANSVKITGSDHSLVMTEQGDKAPQIPAAVPLAATKPAGIVPVPATPTKHLYSRQMLCMLSQSLLANEMPNDWETICPAILRKVHKNESSVSHFLHEVLKELSIVAQKPEKIRAKTEEAAAKRWTPSPRTPTPVTVGEKSINHRLSYTDEPQKILGTGPVNIPSSELRKLRLDSLSPVSPQTLNQIPTYVGHKTVCIEKHPQYEAFQTALAREISEVGTPSPELGSDSASIYAHIQANMSGMASSLLTPSPDELDPAREHVHSPSGSSRTSSGMSFFEPDAPSPTTTIPFRPKFAYSKSCMAISASEPMAPVLARANTIPANLVSPKNNQVDNSTVATYPTAISLSVDSGYRSPSPALHPQAALFSVGDSSKRVAPVLSRAYTIPANLVSPKNNLADNSTVATYPTAISLSLDSGYRSPSPTLHPQAALFSTGGAFKRVTPVLSRANTIPANLLSPKNNLADTSTVATYPMAISPSLDSGCRNSPPVLHPHASLLSSETASAVPAVAGPPAVLVDHAAAGDGSRTAPVETNPVYKTNISFRPRITNPKLAFMTLKKI